MRKGIAGIILVTCLAWPALSQPAEAPPKFAAADVQVSPKAAVPTNFMRTGPVRNGRYEIKNASMVDLIRTAYGFDADKVLGGPNWLEMDRFDVIAKIPPETTPETQKQMLQALLEERFKLVVHKDTKALPTYALVAGKKPQLKEAAGTEEPGCKPEEASGSPGEGGMRFMMNMNGVVSTYTLGPGSTIQFHCKNMTMASFAENIRSMIGADLGTNPIIDDTGLKGRWNFDIRWSIGFIMLAGSDSGDRISVFDAVEKQLGLKLEKREVPTPVIVVDSVNQKPIPNPPGTAEILPPIPPPTEFDVASVKPADPGGRGMSFGMQAGGRFTSRGMPLHQLVNRAFAATSNDQVVGLPPWADSERFDIDAKPPATAAANGPTDLNAVAPMMRALLVDRFKMTYHTEDQQVSGYSLVAGKPKMKKADPASRTFCKFPSPPPGSPMGTRVLNCQNVTMTQFAENLRGSSQEITWPVLDTTELSGGWDLTLTWTMNFMMMAGLGGGRGGDAGAAAPSASDPTGGLSIFEAIEKQLGLKLEKQKRTAQVIVIDHLEQKPTEN